MADTGGATYELVGSTAGLSQHADLDVDEARAVGLAHSHLPGGHVTAREEHLGLVALGVGPGDVEPCVSDDLLELRREILDLPVGSGVDHDVPVVGRDRDRLGQVREVEDVRLALERHRLGRRRRAGGHHGQEAAPPSSSPQAVHATPTRASVNSRAGATEARGRA